MYTKNLIPTLFVLILAIAMTACGPSAAATPEPALPAPTESPASTPAEAPAQPTETTAAATEPATAPISFAGDVMPIFESRCINCHGGDQTREGLDMKTYESLMAGSENGPVVAPGDSNNSKLVELLLNGKMPKRGPKLTPAETQTIVDWVDAGALNN